MGARAGVVRRLQPEHGVGLEAAPAAARRLGAPRHTPLERPRLVRRGRVGGGVRVGGDVGGGETVAVGASEEAGGSSGEGEEPLTIRPAPAAPPAAQVARVLLGQPRAAGLLAGGEGHPTRRRNGGWRAELAGGVIGVEEVDALVPCSEGTEAARVGRGGTVEGPVGLEGGKARVAKAGAATVGPARRVGPARGRG